MSNDAVQGKILYVHENIMAILQTPACLHRKINNTTYIQDWNEEIYKINRNDSKEHSASSTNMPSGDM
jgi:hypothetical protein